MCELLYKILAVCIGAIIEGLKSSFRKGFSTLVPYMWIYCSIVGEWRISKFCAVEFKSLDLLDPVAKRCYPNQEKRPLMSRISSSQKQ